MSVIPGCAAGLCRDWFLGNIPLPLPDHAKKAAEILRSLLSAFVLRAAKKSPEGSSFMILSCRVLWEFPRIGACFAVPDFNTAFILLLPELQPVQLSLSIASRSAAACSWLFTRIVRMPKYSAIGRFR